ncbi:MAG: hypothetical protein ACJ780_19710 [Solirubrobacteraceae bacterium]
MNPQARLEVFGQELNAETYAVCRFDMMLKGQHEHRGDFDPKLGFDAAELFAFIEATQQPSWERLIKAHGGDPGRARERFRLRLAQQIDERGRSTSSVTESATRTSRSGSRFASPRSASRQSWSSARSRTG